MSENNILAKLDVRSPRSGLDEKNHYTIGDVSQIPSEVVLGRRGDRFGKSQWTSEQINAWMVWVEQYPPDVWLELEFHKKTSKKKAFRILKGYLDGLARDKRIKRHITSRVFGDFQYWFDDNGCEHKSYHFHIAIYFESRSRKFNYHQAAVAMSERWNELKKKRDGSFSRVRLGKVLVSPYFTGKRGMAYGMGKHSDEEMFVSCYGANKCIRSGECVYKYFE